MRLCSLKCSGVTERQGGKLSAPDGVAPCRSRQCSSALRAALRERSTEERMPAFRPVAAHGRRRRFVRAPNLALSPNAVGLERLQGLPASRAHGAYLG